MTVFQLSWRGGKKSDPAVPTHVLLYQNLFFKTSLIFLGKPKTDGLVDNETGNLYKNQTEP